MQVPLSWRVRNALRWGYVLGWLTHKAAHLFTALTGAPVLLGSLHIVKYLPDGTAIDYGCVSYRVVTTAYVDYLVDELQSSQAGHSTFKYHYAGTGATAESAANTGIEAIAGGDLLDFSQSEGATSNIYRTDGSFQFDDAYDITEHGLFSTEDYDAPVLMDRSVFAAVPVSAGQIVQFIYRLTVTSGS